MPVAIKVASYKDRMEQGINLQDLGVDNGNAKILKIKDGDIQYVRDNFDQSNVNRPLDKGRTALHFASKYGKLEIVKELLRIDGIDHNVTDHEGWVPLHYAAENGEVNVVIRLLKLPGSETIIIQQAESLLCDAPIHLAARLGHTEVLKEMIRKEPNCVTSLGYIEETPLHLAAENGHFNAVRAIFESTRKPEVNSQSKHGETPLHSAAKGGSLEITKFLCDNDAEVNPKAMRSNLKTPFHKAVFYGNVHIAMYLLEKGAVVTSSSFRDVINEGFEKLAKAVIARDKWPLALRGTYKRFGKETTAFRELIKRMPDVAEMVLNKCVVVEPNRKGQTTDRNDESEYHVIYNYEFIEDYQDQIEETGQISGSNLQIEFSHDNSEENGEKAASYSWGYDDIKGSKSPPVWKDRLKKFNKSTHPLQIMVDRKQLNLLNHPVVGSLIHYKWLKFGLYNYIANMLMYIIYLIFLVTFAVIVPNPQEPQCNLNTTSLCSLNTTNLMLNASNTCIASPNVCDSKEAKHTGLAVVVLIFAIIRLVFEGVQFASQPHSYLKDWINWVENTQYACTIAFVSRNLASCFCVTNQEWEVGVAAVFLSWIVMILFVTKVPFFGIYVLILIKICITFLKFTLLAGLLVVAFGIPFSMTFFDFNVKRSPFSNVFSSLVKTITMTTGEFEYDDIFRVHPSGDSDMLNDIKYPHISYILWIVFIVIMPLILNNMLISLAVDITNDVLEVAQLETLALQVDQILTVQRFLMFIPCFCKKEIFRKHYQMVSVQRGADEGFQTTKEGFEKMRLSLEFNYRRLKSWLKFNTWGGNHYDQSTVVNQYIQPKDNLEEKVDGITNQLEKLKSTLEEKVVDIEKEIKTMKGAIQSLKTETVDIMRDTMRAVLDDYKRELRQVLTERI